MVLRQPGQRRQVGAGDARVRRTPASRRRGRRNGKGRPFRVPVHRRAGGRFHRTLLFGGIWLYPPDSSAPEGKARLLYEVAPMGFMAEQAGGAATRGPMAKDRVVEVVPEHIHQRSPMFVGSRSMVEGLQTFLEKAR